MHVGVIILLQQSNHIIYSHKYLHTYINNCITTNLLAPLNVGVIILSIIYIYNSRPQIQNDTFYDYFYLLSEILPEIC